MKRLKLLVILALLIASVAIPMIVFAGRFEMGGL